MGEAARVQAMLATKLRLSPQTRLDAKTAKREHRLRERHAHVSARVEIGPGDRTAVAEVLLRIVGRRERRAGEVHLVHARAHEHRVGPEPSQRGPALPRACAKIVHFLPPADGRPDAR